MHFSYNFFLSNDFKYTSSCLVFQNDIYFPLETISEMNEQTLRQVLIKAVEAEPDLMKSFIEGSRQDSNPSSEIAWCSCGRCQAFDDPRMNLCCCQSPCITSKPEFRNLCLRHDVLEIANILNWSYRTNLEPSFTPSTFRNQAYRNFVLWQVGNTVPLEQAGEYQSLHVCMWPSGGDFHK